MAGLIDFMKQVPFLTSLSDLELNLLGRLMDERHFASGTYLYRAGELGDTMMFIKRGVVSVILTNRLGEDAVLAELGEGQFVGEMALLTDRARSADVRAITDCVVYTLKKKDFKDCLRNHVDIALSLLHELALRLERTNAQIADLAFLDVYRRLIHLLNESVHTWDNTSGSIPLDELPTHDELASMVGTSRELIAKALLRLEQDGLLVRAHQCLIIRRLPNSWEPSLT